MKRTLLAFAMLINLVFSGPVNAHDEWTTDDTKREAVYMAFHVIDWSQTRYIAKNLDKVHELNPFLGKDPSVAQVDRHFAVGALLHTGIAYALPKEWRKKFQYITIGMEAGITARNYHIGIKMDF